MPEISRFFGIVIAMFYGDQLPPHFHARYGEHRAIIEIESAAVLTGWLPPRVLGLVTECGRRSIGGRYKRTGVWPGGRRHSARFRRWSEVMMVDVAEVRPLGDHRVFIRFEDGVSGEVDIADVVAFEGVFAPLRDPVRFAEVRVHPELRTLSWPNGADLDPDVLYVRVSGKPMRL